MFGRDGGDPFLDDGAREEFRARLEQSLAVINAQMERLKLRYAEMEARRREYMERVVESLINKDESRAKIYAEEIAEIKKLAEMVRNSQLILLQVKIRLESVLELSEVIGLIVPLISLLAEVKDELSPVAPEVAQNLHELAECIEDFATTAASSDLEPVKMEELSEDGERILREAREKVAERVKEAFPDAPSLDEKEMQVYAYISKNGEAIDIKKCAKELKMNVKDVKAALESLEGKGLIELETEEV